MNDIRQFDNITHTVADDLKVQLGEGGKVSVAAACFSIYAFEALKSELEGIDEFRFIFTSPAFTKEFSTKQKREFFIPKLQRERTLYGSDFELKLRNKMSQRAIAFNKGNVKHIFFIAETKGSLDSMELRGVEKAKIDCARKLFNNISDINIRYDAVNNFDALMNILAN